MVVDAAGRDPIDYSLPLLNAFPSRAKLTRNQNVFRKVPNTGQQYRRLDKKGGYWWLWWWWDDAGLQSNYAGAIVASWASQGRPRCNQLRDPEAL